jgi:hypothetical protein
MANTATSAPPVRARFNPSASDTANATATLPTAGCGYPPPHPIGCECTKPGLWKIDNMGGPWGSSGGC